MTKFWEMLEREDGCLSIGRICALSTFLLWLVTTIYLIISGKSFAHYDTLTIAAVGMLLAQVCNKALESKIFSVKSEDR